ncbi:hydrogenase (NiFe) small subunit HydA [Methanosalsum zhilinae DSM 4017]|uniref:Hydrogenase (NiFe) small subunit HydA n=1 Tax=Methanosalsum zhilinae (strain DSM 4017 / NBRC 107636 / OCM 62 / WeN5) TaxID=679901 RepID=F7XLC0_METZD|nr:oxidoreductase [Methanosalsum zhilinae]AEH60777.1 hydrogenase (NiFe) small subunit HydA [Methanosalsum zhilinae DSM 4017]
MRSDKSSQYTEINNVDILKLDWHRHLESMESTGDFELLENFNLDSENKLELERTKVIWIQTIQCIGCSESLIDGAHPEFFQALQNLKIDISYHEAFLMQQGIFVNNKKANTAEFNSLKLLDEITENNGYILVVEGSIANGPHGTGKYCMIGGLTSKELFEKAARNCSVIIAVGMCATYGGISCARSDIVDLLDFRGIDFTLKDRSKGMMNELGIDKPVINIPGCPPHPDWMLFTLGALVSGNVKIPDDLKKVLDEYGRPKVFFPPEYTVHDDCPHIESFKRKDFSECIGEEKCLLKLGCKGPSAHADCSLRKWNNRNNYCPQAGSPCVACVEPDFPDSARPVYTIHGRKKKRN